MNNCKKCIKNKFWLKFLPENFLQKCHLCNQYGMKRTKSTIFGEYFAIVIYIIFFLLAYYMVIN